MVAGCFFVGTISGCRNPVIGSWTEVPPPVVRVPNPVGSTTPSWIVSVPSGATDLSYRFDRETIADGEHTALVEWTTVSLSAIPSCEDESVWDRSVSRWAVITDASDEATDDATAETGDSNGEREIRFSFEETLEEATYAYTLTITAGYEGGVSDRSARRTVVDVTAPPKPDLAATMTIATETAEFTWDGPDDDIGGYLVSWDYADEESVPCVDSGGGPTGSFIAPELLGDGETHTLTVWALDTAGNRSEAATSTISVRFDQTIPVFPATDNVTQSAYPQPTWNWLAPPGSSKVRYRMVSGVDVVVVDWTEIEVDTASPTGSITPADGLAEGAYTVTMQAWFPSDASWSEENSHTITVALCDLEAPAVSGEARTNRLQPEFSWPDPAGAAGYRYQLNAQGDAGWNEIQEDDLVREPGTVRFPIPTELAVGTHTIYLQAMDPDSIWSESGSFTFVIETEAPRLESLALYSSDDTPVSADEYEHLPPDAYIEVAFSEPVDLLSGSVAAIESIPATEFDAPVDVSAGESTRFKVTPTGGWTEGESYLCKINLQITDLAGNVLDVTTFRQKSFETAVYVSSAIAPGSMPDATLASIMEDMNPGGYTWQITSLDLTAASYDGTRDLITDLTGLSAFDSLRYVDLGGCTGITDSANPGELGALPGLSYLSLNNTGVTDLSFLSSGQPLLVLKALKDEGILGPGYDRITSIAPLASITGLATLDLRGNDLGSTADDATDLVTPLETQATLQTLLLSNNPNLVDVGFLTASLATLEVLYLDGCGISAIDLTNQSELSELVISDNPIATITGVPPVVSRIDLENASVTDLGFVSGVGELTELSVSGTTLTDISGLTGNTSIVSLELASCGLDNADLSTIGALSQLTYLDLSGNTFSDVSQVVALTALETLDLSQTGLTTLPAGSAWSGLSNLMYLDLSKNRIANVAPLAGLFSVGTLILADNVSGGSTTITDGIIELQDLYAIEDEPEYPPYPLYYLVFSGNVDMGLIMGMEYSILESSTPSWTTIYGPETTNPYEDAE